MDPTQNNDLLTPTNALIAAVKPIYLVSLGLVLVVWQAFGFVQRVERIEEDVRVIRLILCEKSATDSYCKRDADD